MKISQSTHAFCREQELFERRKSTLLCRLDETRAQPQPLDPAVGEGRDQSAEHRGGSGNDRGRRSVAEDKYIPQKHPSALAYALVSLLGVMMVLRDQ